MAEVAVMHISTLARRDMQLRAYYEKLPRSENGKLTERGRDAWSGWLRIQGLSHERARQILKSRTEQTPINSNHAKRCIEYLRGHGYLVNQPKEIGND